MIDLQPIAQYYGPGGSRTQIAVIGYTYGNLSKGWFPYFGGGIGFFTLQVRGGVSFLPGNLEESGPVIRLEAQPQVLFNPCWEHFVVGSLGVGWRWPLEEGDPGYPGTAFFVVPAFTGGAAFLHHDCGKPTEAPLHASYVLGGTLFTGFDF